MRCFVNVKPAFCKFVLVQTAIKRSCRLHHTMYTKNSPVFVQVSDIVTPRTMRYNTVTKRFVIHNICQLGNNSLLCLKNYFLCFYLYPDTFFLPKTHVIVILCLERLFFSGTAGFTKETRQTLWLFTMHSTNLLTPTRMIWKSQLLKMPFTLK